MKRMLSTRRALGATLLVGVATLAAVMVATTGRAFSATSAEYQYKPVLKAEPRISGTAAVGQTLTTTTGSWEASGTITYTVRWYRCDGNGNNCSEIPGASSTAYKVTTADNGKRLRSYVYAAASGGTTLAVSNPTAIVGTPSSSGTVQATSVKLPNRLTIDKTQYSQNPIKSRTGTTAKFHVVESSGKSVQGARVFVLGVPYSRIQEVPEAVTDSSGWATVQLVPDKFFPRKGYLVLFVRASVPGQDVLAGSSTRRLVQVTIAPPA